MKYSILIFFFLFSFSNLPAQEWIIQKKVHDQFENKGNLKSISPFKYSRRVMRKDHSDPSYEVYNLNPDFLDSVLSLRPKTLEIVIPSGSGTVLTAQLILADLGNIRFTVNNREPVYDVIAPVIYTGVLKDEPRKNSVRLTLNENYFSLSVDAPDRNIQIAQSKDNESKEYILSEIDELEQKPVLPCGTLKEPSSQAMMAMERANDPARSAVIDERCVYVFVECFDSLYQWRGSSYQQTINYVYDLFNAVATGFRNEQINIKISGINIWTTMDPYRQDNRDNALADLAAYYQDNFWGNICVGLDASNFSNPSRSGVAGAIGRMKGDEPYSCPAYTVDRHPFCYNDMNYFGNYQNFPTASIATADQIYLVMHEMGHLFGSPHTHWCGWIITTTPVVIRGALDNCENVESICSSTCTTDCTNCPPCAAGPAPTNGGTIMSYCIGPGEFVNFNNGFGSIPGNAIRSFLDTHPCISNCPPCPVSQTVGNLFTGVHRFEASNTITANGVLSSGSYVSLDAGQKIILSPGFRANGGSRVRIFIDGCANIR